MEKSSKITSKINSSQDITKDSSKIASEKHNNSIQIIQEKLFIEQASEQSQLTFNQTFTKRRTHYKKHQSIGRSSSQGSSFSEQLIEGYNQSNRGQSLYLPQVHQKMKPISAYNQKPLQKILIFIKPFDQEIIKNFLDLINFMYIEFPNTQLLVDQWVIDEASASGYKYFKLPELFVNSGTDARKEIDFIITLGGDGTILWANKQFFTDYIPPLISFAQGSLGYLCNFTFDEYKQVLQSVLTIGKKLHLDTRMRLKASVLDKPVRNVFKGNDLYQSQEQEITEYHVMNEVVVDRGPSPYAIQLEIYFDNKYITTLVGDGLIISTPTGSTAYNMSAGGSIVQSNTQCICVTPLAPHSLSFRPLILPISTQIKLRKPKDNRNSAWVSLDGANRFELTDGEQMIIEASSATIKMVVTDSDDLMDLWAQRLVHMLNWNQRQILKPLTKKQQGNI